MTNNSWLEWAVEVEEGADCDVEAGPDVGSRLVEYMECLEGSVTYEKLLDFLKRELENVLTVEEIETIADSTLKDVSKRVRERQSNLKTA